MLTDLFAVIALCPETGADAGAQATKAPKIIKKLKLRNVFIKHLIQSLSILSIRLDSFLKKAIFLRLKLGRYQLSNNAL